MLFVVTLLTRIINGCRVLAKRSPSNLDLQLALAAQLHILHRIIALVLFVS
jgi:hypothetical protein